MKDFQQKIENALQQLAQTTDKKEQLRQGIIIIFSASANDHHICQRYIPMVLKLCRELNEEDTAFNIKLLQIVFYLIENKYEEMSNYIEDVISYLEVRLQNNDVWFYHHNVGILFLNLGFDLDSQQAHEQALAHLHRALDLIVLGKFSESDYAKMANIKIIIYAHISSVYLRTERYEEAAYYIELFRIASENTQQASLIQSFLVLKAELLFRTEQYEMAYEYTNRALNMEPMKLLRTGELSYWRGKIAAKLGHWEAAKQDLTQAVAIAQQFKVLKLLVDCQIALADVLAELKQSNEAYQLAKKAIEIKDNSKKLQSKYALPFLQHILLRHGILFVQNALVEEWNVERKPDLDNIEQQKATLICWLIQHNYKKSDWGTAQLAKGLNTSLRNLQRKTEAYFGKTPLELLTLYRLHIAKALLRQKLLTIKQIAQQVGYKSESYFSQVFSKYNHCTPSIYKAENR